MRFSLVLLLLVGGLALISGCSQDDSVLDSTLNESAILLKDMVMSHYVVDTDTLDVIPGEEKSDDDPVTIPLKITVQVLGAEQLGQLRCQVREDGRSTILASADMMAEGGGFYTALIELDRKRKDVGDYRVEVIGSSIEGEAANSAHSRLRIIYGNQPPVLSDLVAPDTVQVPAAGNTLIRLKVRVTDPSGLEDINRVEFNSFLPPDGRPSENNPFPMFDDGTAGDEVAGDGIYTTTIELAAGTTKGTYRFEFRALDFSNSLSNVIIHFMELI